MQNELESIRKRINAIDNQLLELLNERAQIALKAGRLQAKMGTRVYDPDRERAILERIAALNPGPLNKGAVEELFATIMGACREIQLR